MELVFLGTGAGLPSKERNVSAIALTLLQELNSIWLFDCGEATQHQILYTSIKPRKISKIFITHLHGDHIFGLPGFLSSRSFQGGDSLLTIYGPKGIKEYVEMSLRLSKSHLTYPLEIIEFEEGLLFEEDGFTVSCKLLEHGIPSYGFRIIESDRLGGLLVDELKEIGVLPGPIYQQIKQNEVTELPNGQIIKRADFISADKPGRTISILGDTLRTMQNQDFVKNADVLVHEATFNAESKSLADEYFHSTTAEAAELAKTSGVKQLVLTHISSRYQKEDYDGLLEEAKSIFPNTVMADDFYTYPISVKNQ